MLTYLRYALATICFALSVACLGLWWRSMSKWEVHNLRAPIASTRVLNINTYYGTISIVLLREETSRIVGFNAGENWQYHDFGPREIHDDLLSARHREGMFSQTFGYFPLWYPALIFALAGVAALRLGRRFTLRSAIIATTVVAGLLGIVVAL